jgi:hypothetical protein
MTRKQEAAKPKEPGSPKKIAIIASMKSGPEAMIATEVPGTRHLFAYWVDDRDKMYHVTHVPTGLAPCVCANEKDAIDMSQMFFRLFGQHVRKTEPAVFATLLSKDMKTVIRSAKNVAKRFGSNVVPYDECVNTPTN